MTSAAPLLDARDLSVRRGSRLAAADVSCTLHGGEVLSVVGPNGAGKTSLLLALVGILRRSTGLVRLGGVGIDELSATQRARRAALVPQWHGPAPPFLVREVVAQGRYAHRDRGRRACAAAAATIDAAMERAGVGGLARRRFDTLSGGERQKTMLAAALAQDAPLIALDEPNAGLDPAYQVELIRVLRELRAGGRALLVVSHDLQLPAALGGQVLALRDGRVAAFGAAAKVLSPPVLERVYGARFDLAQLSDGRAVALPAWWDPDHRES